jgi:hypothetical protein
VELDHVLVAVADLATAAGDFETRYGLSSIEGGRHPAWGTANRIVPLGDSYIELVTVLDATAARDSVLGRWVAEGMSEEGRPIGWAVRTLDIDTVAQRLGLPVRNGSRKNPDGTLIQWRSAGIEQAAAEPALPFFIEWTAGTTLPGRAAINHRAGPARISRLMVDGDATRLKQWLGGQGLPVVVRPGPPAVAGIVVLASAQELVVCA